MAEEGIVTTMLRAFSFSLRWVGPGPPAFLDGRVGNGTLGLAPATTEPFTGTHWQAIDDGQEDPFNHFKRVVLRCLAPSSHANFLDARILDLTVGLAPATDGVFTGTHWIINPRRKNQIALDHVPLSEDHNRRYLSGLPDGTVRLTHHGSPLSGAIWEVVNVQASGIIGHHDIHDLVP